MYINYHHSQDQLLEFCVNFYKTISSEFLEGINPNLPTGMVGKVQNKQGGRKEGRVGLEPGTYCMLGKSPQLYTMEAV